MVYDLCAGTGCLGLGIARAVPSAKVTCVELSHDAWPYLTAKWRRWAARPPRPSAAT